MIMPVTSCEAERNFSLMNRIKCKLRNRLMNFNLNNLMFITSYKSNLNKYGCLDNTDLNKLFKLWWNKDRLINKYL